jgi:phage shock protein A
VAVKKLLTIAEASEITGLSRRALARRIERGSLSAVRRNGLRYLESRELASAGLLNLQTGRPPDWAGGPLEPEAVARELVQTVIRQTLELAQLQEAVEKARQEREAIRAKIAEMDADRADLRAELERATRRGRRS